VRKRTCYGSISSGLCGSTVAEGESFASRRIDKTVPFRNLFHPGSLVISTVPDLHLEAGKLDRVVCALDEICAVQIDGVVYGLEIRNLLVSLVARCIRIFGVRELECSSD
jgi:hypothetical protein